jgi:uncharacterized protein YdbL (DUF1318 family)
MKTKLLATTLISSSILVGVLSACLTLNVNVHFPESAVQQATDDYVHQLYLQKEKGKTAKPDTPTPRGETPPRSGLGISLFASAWADGAPQFKIDSPAATQIKEKLAGLLNDVLAQKRAGVLGESHDGKLVLKAPEKLKSLLAQRVQKVVTDENAIREDLYKEILSSNHMSANHLIDVKKSFARSFQSESPTGTWLQDDEGKWSQK